MERSDGMIEKNLYRLICSFLLACILTFHFGTYLGIQYDGIVCVAIVFGIVCFVSLFAFLVEKYKWIAVLVLLAIVVAIGMILGWNTIYAYIRGYISWFSNGAGTGQQGLALFSVIQMVWIGIFSYGLQVLMERIFYIKLAFGILLVGLLTYFLFSGTETSFMGVMFSISFLILIVAEWTELKWKKEKQHHSNVYMLRIMIFIGIFFFVSLHMPTSEKPYKWEYVKAAAEYCGEKIRLLAYDIFQGVDTYDLALSGFSDEARLGAGIEDNDKEIMLVTTDRNMGTNLYLAGKYFNTFENLEWMAYQQEEYYDRNIDTLQTSYAVLKYDSLDLNLALMKITLDVVYQDLNTAYLFAPGKLYTVKDEEQQKIDYTIDDGSIFFRNNQNYGSGYRAVFYQMNSSIQPFVDFLETSVEYDEALWNRTLTRYEQTTGIYITYEQLEAYEQRCYEDYMIAPVLSLQVQDYLNRMTEDCESDIDKLLAIQSELLSYTYTKTPGELPEDVVDETSFLDYFLLESQEGYCTYYATAFTLLARAEGFPARYVQGYCVPMYGGNSETVLSSMAHAWPEVYLKDIGWVAFEPTPGYSEGRSFAEDKKEYEPYGSNYYAEMYQGETPEDEASAMEEDAIVNTGKEDADSQEFSGNSENITDFLIKLLLIIVAGLLLAWLIVLLTAKIVYKRKSAQEQYRLKVKRNLKLLGVLGAKKEDAETLAEYSKRTLEILENTVELGFIADYEAVTYGNKEVEELLVHRADSQYHENLLCLKKMSYYRYLQYRIIKLLQCDVT